MTYETTRQCNQDIIDIYLRGAAIYGVTQAEQYHLGLVAAFNRLAINPRLARKRAEFSPPVRLYPYRSHMIAYLERNDSILIVRVLHGRQDWERHL